MTYIVTGECVKCKYLDCVEVCPVDCFYEGENMIVIDPDQCIDCGVCKPECPAKAIIPDTHKETPREKMQFWLQVNTKFSKVWPNITENRGPLEDADKWNPQKGYDGDPEKREHISTNPGKGDD